jgi:hypothetical protein
LYYVGGDAVPHARPPASVTLDEYLRQLQQQHGVDADADAALRLAWELGGRA